MDIGAVHQLIHAFYPYYITRVRYLIVADLGGFKDYPTMTIQKPD